MKAPLFPANEAARLAALHALRILDTPPEGELDRITRLAARVLDVPISAISLIDNERQWFKSTVGLGEVRETGRDVSFCGHAILREGPFVVRNALADARFCDNPLVTQPPFIRAYAGQPIHSRSGHALGTLCVIDDRPRDFSPRDLESLRDLAALVEQHFRAADTAREATALRRDLEVRVAQRTAELRRQKERLRLVLEMATDAYVATDDKGVITGWNVAAERIFGWTRADAIGRTLMDTIIPPGARGPHFEYLQHFGATGESRAFKRLLELDARRRDGSVFPVEISLTANRIGHDWLISAFIRDITARKAADASLREAWHKAEEALRAAEAANRAKTDFLATMSHEIRTPLNGVIGFNGLLLDSPLTPEQHRYAELARQSGEALLHLLNDFLDFSKIEAGHLELEPVDFDLALEVEHVLALVQEVARGKGLELRLRVHAPYRLRGDAARLRQILLNLLSNAVKFTACGHITLCCEQSDVTDGHVHVCFQVTDTGIGIAADVRPRLFQPFVQADASTTRRYGGTGLGLAICKRLTAAMGGEIGVRSAPGEGSTFWVELPFELADGAAAAPAEVRADLPPAPVAPAHGGRVLVVEDNAVSQVLAAEVFRRLGCQVDVVGNGEEAVAAFRRLPYDLVLMDCDMPVMNGFDATRRIRELEAGSTRVPIVAMTASALQGDAEKCIAAGMDDFMSKPLRFAQMEAMVARWLKPAPLPAVTAPGPLAGTTAGTATASAATTGPTTVDIPESADLRTLPGAGAGTG